MKRTLAVEDEPIHKLLKKLEYEFLPFEFCNPKCKSEWKWKAPSGETRTMKYQKRSGERGRNGRYLVGIAYNCFDHVDDFFWAKDEKYLLVIPSKRLRAVFKANEMSLKKDEDQWHVNICFDLGGTQTLHPVGCESENVSEFAYPI